MVLDYVCMCTYLGHYIPTSEVLSSVLLGHSPSRMTLFKVSKSKVLKKNSLKLPKNQKNVFENDTFEGIKSKVSK